MKKTFLIFLLAFSFSLTAQSQLITPELKNGEHPGHGIIKLWPTEGADFAPRKFKTPTRQLTGDKVPVFYDDLEFARMDVAIQRQLKRYKDINARGTIRFGSTTYKLSDVTKTLEAFHELTLEAKTCLEEAHGSIEAQKRCNELFNQEIRERFNVFKPHLAKNDPRYGEDRQTFFTSYYTPTLNVSRVRSSEKRHGLYLKPRQNSLRRSTFSQIYFQDRLENKGLNLFYTDNLFELYLLHIQGGGKVVFVEEDGSQHTKYVHYASSNSRTFRWISIYMKEKGYIPDGKISSQREYLDKHPEKHKEIFGYNLSVIYYTEQEHPAVGSGGVSVTPGRSIATDWRNYGYKGLLTYIEAQRPTEDSILDEEPQYKDFSRFMLDQDTGGAIKGKARVDIFHGEDKYAEVAAFNTQHTGNLYYLMLKK